MPRYHEIRLSDLSPERLDRVLLARALSLVTGARVRGPCLGARPGVLFVSSLAGGCEDEIPLSVQGGFD